MPEAVYDYESWWTVNSFNTWSSSGGGGQVIVTGDSLNGVRYFGPAQQGLAFGERDFGEARKALARPLDRSDLTPALAAELDKALAEAHPEMLAKTLVKLIQPQVEKIIPSDKQARKELAKTLEKTCRYRHYRKKLALVQRHIRRCNDCGVYDGVAKTARTNRWMIARIDWYDEEYDKQRAIRQYPFLKAKEARYCKYLASEKPCTKCMSCYINSAGEQAFKRLLPNLVSGVKDLMTQVVERVHDDVFNDFFDLVE